MSDVPTAIRWCTCTIQYHGHRCAAKREGNKENRLRLHSLSRTRIRTNVGKHAFLVRPVSQSGTTLTSSLTAATMPRLHDANCVVRLSCSLHWTIPDNHEDRIPQTLQAHGLTSLLACHEYFWSFRVVMCRSSIQSQ